MNANSYVCSELSEIAKSENLNQQSEHVQLLNVFRERYPDIGVKVDYPFAIFNYGIGADFTNPVVQESRGIIINLDTLDVVCWPFRKFGRYDEPYADTIDWTTARVQDKIDGSIIKLWFNKITGKWQFSSNSCINADDAMTDEYSMRTLMDIIKTTSEFQGFEDGKFFDHTELDVNNTYIFELISPLNRVVVYYPTPQLIHTGTRNNITGKELDIDIGLTKPTEHQISSLKTCIEFATTLNENENGTISNVEREGFVVVDANWNRIKVKSPEYMIIHHLVSITKESKKQLIQLILERRIDVSGMAKEFPNLAHILYFYLYQVSELEYKATAMINIARWLFIDADCDRKAVALKISKNKYAPFGFKAISDFSIDADDIIADFGFQKLIKYIPDYETGDMKYLLVPDGDE